MIIPSIDLMSGRAVQLVGGAAKELDAGDPRPLAEEFRIAGEIAVIDLDAAMSQGANREVIEELCQMAPCRVGGGIRDVETARRWLDAGARKVILGTAARPDILKQLPRQRVMAAVDAVDGEVVVEGWTESTGDHVLDQIEALRPYVGGFLVTFVEREGRLQGTDEQLARRVIDAAGERDVTIAGGISTADEIAMLDRLGADAQVGMALYKEKLHLGDAISAPLSSDRDDGLWPTVVCDERGTALGLAYSDDESLRAAVDERRGIYHSRRRGLWKKGETSGAIQQLVGIDLDCDRDALRFRVRQQGDGFCHRSTRTCWGDDPGLGRLERTLRKRLDDAPEGSYTQQLLDSPELLEEKLVEEARELAAATETEDVVWETADVLYFALVAMVRGEATLEDVERELARRAQRVTRRSSSDEEN